MFRDGKFKKSIATKVVTQITTFVAIIIVLLLCFIAYSNVTYLQEKANENLQKKAQDLARDVNQKFEYLREKTELLGKNELIINAFVDVDSRDKYLFPLIKNFREDGYLNKLSIVDFDGRNCISNRYQHRYGHQISRIKNGFKFSPNNHLYS